MMERVDLPTPILNQYKMRTKQKDFVGGNPVTLETKHIYSLWKKNFNVTPKVDGTRYLCIFDKLGENPNSVSPKRPYFIDRGLGGTQLRVFQPKHTNGQTPSPRLFPSCILDGEIVFQQKSGRTKCIYWIFDVLSFQGEMVTHLPFHRRFDILNNLKKHCDTQNVDSNWLKLIVKPYYSPKSYLNSRDPYEDITKEFRKFCKTADLPKPVLDGLIINDVNTPYVKGPWSRCDNIQFKWKPTDEQTIDVVLGKNNEVFGRDGNKYTYKYTHRKTQKEYTLKLDKPTDLPSVKPRVKNDLVVELRLTGIDLERRLIKTSFVRFRTDKQANAYRTINSVITAWIYPVKNLKDLFGDNPRKVLKYFTKTQMLRILGDKSLFSASVVRNVRELLRKEAPDSKKPLRKIVFRFPDKRIPVDCFLERDFPKATIHEIHNSKGEFIVLEDKLKIPKYDGQPKSWAADTDKITKINTSVTHQTPILAIPMSLKPAGSAAVAKRGKIVKTIFRITHYTNIIFEKPERGESTYYVETYPGENDTVVFKLLKLILQL